LEPGVRKAEGKSKLQKKPRAPQEIIRPLPLSECFGYRESYDKNQIPIKNGRDPRKPVKKKNHDPQQ
ncbi:MAG: hypothetical protein ACREGC_02655, partial [Minisyncoccia bacterium]